MMRTHLEAIVFDWAGTIVDFGSFAPTQIFVDAFREAFDFDLSLEEARRPMGLGKWQHIEALSQDSGIKARWLTQFGRPMQSSDIQAIYDAFLPLQIERVGLHSALIPGALEVVNQLKNQGFRLASTTGYPRKVMEQLMPLAERQGYSPECTVCADDLAVGARPGPWMALECVQRLGLGAVSHCVKVDDTLPGIAEGLNAGMWTVGLALSGSPAGWTLSEFQEASEAQRLHKRTPIEQMFKAQGAHYVIDTVADLPDVLSEIEERLARSERP